MPQTTYGRDSGQPTQTTFTNDAIGMAQVLVSDDGNAVVYNLLGHDLIGQPVNGNPQFLTLIGDHIGILLP